MKKLATTVLCALAFVSSTAAANVIFEWVHVSGDPMSLRVELTDTAITYEHADYWRTFECDNPANTSVCESSATDIVSISGRGLPPNSFQLSTQPGATGWVKASVWFGLTRAGYLGGNVNIHTDETEFIATSIPRPQGMLGPLWSLSLSASDRSPFTCGRNGNVCNATGYLLATSPIPEIPEPGSIALIGLALVGMISVRSRRNTENRPR